MPRCAATKMTNTGRTRWEKLQARLQPYERSNEELMKFL